MSQHQMEMSTRALVAEGKGILAADESLPTIAKRFKSIALESTAESRRFYREMLFTTSGIEEFISGVILFDETIRQLSSDGTPLVEMLAARGIIPGIKVDRGTTDLAGFTGETITEGLDGLRQRLMEYREMGARFAKWRAVIKIGQGIPSPYCIKANAHALARYAALCQKCDLVPIVEPEVLMDGNHNINQCSEATEATLNRVFFELNAHRVVLENMLLKPNMVLPGKKCPQQASSGEIAETTVTVFRRVVPAAVPGIVFLSGGLSAEEATANLNAMNTLGPHPWQLSFSFGRALQAPVLETWAGDTAMVTEAQRRFYHRARLNGAARRGQYSLEMEAAPS